jgi:hypothetical protein
MPGAPTIEAEKLGSAVGHAVLALAEGDDQSRVQGATAEVALVQPSAEDGLLQGLQLGQRKPRRQKLRSDQGVLRPFV